MINTDGLSAADLAAVVGNNNGDGFGNGNGAWWLLILLIFANNGWGNNGGWGGNSGGGAIPYMMGCATQADVQNGFDQAAIMSGITGITSAVSNGFANAEISRANTLASITNQMNNLGMAQLQNGFNSQLAVANLGAQIASEACADRQAVNDGVRDLMAQGVSNTNALLNTMNNGIRAIQDQLFQDKMDNKNETIAQLRQQLAMKDLEASQTAQNAYIAQGFANEVDQLYNRLNSCPVPTTPVYGRTPIFTCPGNGFNCGCGCGN